MADQPGQYDWITDDMFDDKFRDMAESHDLLDIPGVYELVKEDYNNDVIEALEKDHPELALEGRWLVFVHSFKDKLLQPDIQHCEWWCVDSDVLCGDDEQLYYQTELFTQEAVHTMFSDHVKLEDIEKKTMWGVRMSAPGYLDCSTWDLFETAEDAKESLMEEFGDDT